MKKIFWLSFFVFSMAMSQNNTEKVTLRVEIENRTGDSITIRGRNFSKIIVANKDGVFSDSFSVTDGFHQFSDGNEFSLMYLKNGYDLTMKLNTEAFDETIFYIGNGANENNYLAQKSLLDEKIEADLQEYFNESEEKAYSYIDQRAKEESERLASLNLDETFKKLIANNISQESLMMKQFLKQKAKSKKMEGQPSPSFNYENYAGGNTQLEDFKGKYVYIDVWATWCGPCRAEIPHLKRVEKEFHDKNIVFLSISIDKKTDYEKWRTFVKEKELGGVQLFADKDWSSKFVQDYAIDGIPRFILIDDKGNVLKADAPRPSSKELSKLLNEILK